MWLLHRRNVQDRFESGSLDERCNICLIETVGLHESKWRKDWARRSVRRIDSEWVKRNKQELLANFSVLQALATWVTRELIRNVQLAAQGS